MEKILNIVPVELRNKLPDFSFDQNLEFDESVQSYRDFYHLDFEQRYVMESHQVQKVMLKKFWQVKLVEEPICPELRIFLQEWITTVL